VTWLTARQFILPALKDDNEASLVSSLAQGHAQLFEGSKSAFVTQIVGSARTRTIHAWLAGGELVELLSLIPGLEAWARAHGCKYATVTGRKGWDRALRPLGYERVGAELRKAL
jgi:hypothetical protein